MRTGGFEIASSALTSSILKWLHRIQCSFKFKTDRQPTYGSMFPVLVFGSHFQILLVRKLDTRPKCFTSHLVAPYRYIALVYNTQYVSTHKAIYGRQKQKFRTISFRFAPLHRMCDAMTLLHATHSPELPRSVGRDGNDATAGGRYGCIWLTFWTFIIQR
jgi:hypothetical protein